MLILASQSPRRKELMEKYISIPFKIVPSDYQETLNEKASPIENVINIAKGKGMDIFSLYQNDIIISCDTIVTLNNKIYGKPIDIQDAYRILKELSNKTHQVITAYWIISKDYQISNYVISNVTFNDLSDELINEYISTLSPLDKAGAYGIQDPLGKHIVNHYEGSLNNIIGMPIEEIKKELVNLKIL